MKTTSAYFKLGISPEVAHEVRSCITAVLYLAELFRNDDLMSGREYDDVQTVMSRLLHCLEKARDNT